MLHVFQASDFAEFFEFKKLFTNITEYDMPYFIFFRFFWVVLLVLTSSFSVFYFGGQDNFTADDFEDKVIELNNNFRGLVFPKTSIVIVDIDKQSIGKEGTWPWSTEKMTDLLDKIANQHPIAIGLNILFDDSDRNGKENFAKAISSSNLIVAVALKYPNTIRFWNDMIKTYNIHIDMGYVDNVIELKSGVVGKNATLNESILDSKIAAFAKEVSKYIADNNYSALKESNFKVTFYAPEGAFRHVPAYKILEEDNNTISLKDKLVLVGADMDIGRVLTPFGEMSLTEVEANIIQSISDRNFIKNNMLINFFIYFVCGGLVVISVVTKRLLLLFISVFLFFLLWHILFVLFNLAIPVIGMLIAQIFNIVIGLLFPYLTTTRNP